MPVSIPANYPKGCTDEQLTSLIMSLNSEVIQSGANINTVLQFTPLINLGENELQQRYFKKINRLIVFTALLSLLISLSALYYAYSGNKSDKNWQAEQLKLIHEISDKMPNNK